MSRVLAQRRPRPTRVDEPFVASFQRLVGEVFRLNGELLRTAEQLCCDLDITPARWQTIAVIREQPMTAAQIGRQLGLSRQAVQQTLRKLKEQGLVELLPNPAHQRAWLIGLSPAGKRVMAELYARQAELTARFTEELNLNRRDVDRLRDQLREMREAAQALDPDLVTGE
ncbi:MAG: MarR family transcriptional regulator [Chromatiales bacterium]|nr:MarR family transcriptional regulator [Chromatiales bacterium]